MLEQARQLSRARGDDINDQPGRTDGVGQTKSNFVVCVAPDNSGSRITIVSHRYDVYKVYLTVETISDTRPKHGRFVPSRTPCFFLNPLKLCTNFSVSFGYVNLRENSRVMPINELNLNCTTVGDRKVRVKVSKIQTIHTCNACNRDM